MTTAVFITLGGKERRLRYDINTAAEIEELLGGRSLLFILGNPASAGFSVIRTLLWGGMKHAEKGLTLQRVGLLMQEYLENDGSLETISETIGEAVRRSGILGNNYYASGEYTAQTVDVGQIVTCNLSNLFSSTVNLRGVGSAALQISTSRDNVTWTAWQNFKPAQYTFRYLKYKALLSTNDLSKTPEITQLMIVLDVDDDNRSGSANVAVGGSTISLNVSDKTGYYTVPVVIPMAIGANKFAQIISITKNDFKVTVLDRAGNDVGGQINWTSYGY